MDVQAELQTVFREVFDDPALVITRATTAEDIEDWDSIAQMNLLVAIEEHFHMRFKMEETTRFQNVGEMMDIITERVGK